MLSCYASLDFFCGSVFSVISVVFLYNKKGARSASCSLQIILLYFQFLFRFIDGQLRIEAVFNLLHRESA